MRSSRLEIRRLKLVKASLKIFAAKGFHQTVVSDIADASKIGHGTFYGYFTNKSMIFKALVEHIYGRILTTLEGESFDASDTLLDYRLQLGRIGDRLFELFREEPELAQVVFFESWAAGAEIAKLSEAAFTTLERVTQQFLDHGVERGYLREDFDTSIAARAINIMLFESIKSVLRSQTSEVEYSAWKVLIPLLITEGLAHTVKEV